METEPQGGPQLAQGWVPRRFSKPETPSLELLSPTAFHKDSPAPIFRSPAWILTFARNRQQYAVTWMRRSIVPYRDGSMMAKRLGSCMLAQSVTTLFLSGDARRIFSSNSAMVRRGHCYAGSFSQAGPLVLTESVQGAAAAELISRIVRGGTMPPLRRLSPAEDVLNAIRHERIRKDHLNTSLRTDSEGG
ncbi:hypothetical protein T4C_6548 [Trichinella pseudospiralis]|uniref:Uncharacterized protein n=1 Tax=Trichinella pseudospiralis TaxID=6337 RepID=A0A0V1K003_TRIPS|nr:hypothetical protein T4C_6548 [Trichinella pseudospiralis]